MAFGHAKHEIGLGDKCLGEGLAAVVGSAQADLGEGFDGVGGDFFAFARGDAGGDDLAGAQGFRFGQEGVAEEGLGHGATADVGGANRNDEFGRGHEGYV